MRDHELKAAIREKQAAWEQVALAERARLAWERNGRDGPELEGLETWQDEARDRHADTRSRYLRLALGRR